jgi:hypothetical protein
MIDWKKLCADSHRISKEHGWLDVKRTVAGDIALMHSEISEALEDYRVHRGLDEIYYEDKNHVKYQSLEMAEKTTLWHPHRVRRLHHSHLPVLWVE